MAVSDTAVDVQPLAACEREQLVRFTELLREEIESMRRAVTAAEARRPRKRTRSFEERERRLERLRARIDEAGRLIESMDARLHVG